MGMSAKRACDLQYKFAGRVQDIWRRAVIYTLPHARILELLKKEVWEDSLWKRIPGYAQSFVFGVEHVCLNRHYEHLVYSYEINGVRMTIESAEYREVSPQEVSLKWLDTGAYVYRSNTERAFSVKSPSWVCQCGETKPENQVWCNGCNTGRPARQTA